LPPADEHIVDFLTGLLTAERARPGARATRPRSGDPGVALVLDDTRMRQFATDNQISVSTGYDYLNEGIEPAQHPPGKANSA
jgi:hypothetical protein